MNPDIQKEPAQKIFEMVKLMTPKGWQTITFVFETPDEEGKQRYSYDATVSQVAMDDFFIRYIQGLLNKMRETALERAPK